MCYTLKQISFKENLEKVKNYIEKMPKKNKTVAISILGSILLLSVILTMFLQTQSPGYRVLYHNIDESEASEIYQVLKEMGVQAELNASGEVMVPKSQYDSLLLTLAGKGYPQTALSYDVYSSHSSMTSTESERQQWLDYQLQDRVQDTLKRVWDVNNAAVTIYLPETSDYVWEQATSNENATASILLTMKPGKTLSPTQVTSLKNLVAAAVPNLEAEYVTVVDAKTALEMVGKEEGSTTGMTTVQNFEFERMVQKQIEDNIVRVLSPRYGHDGVVAAVKVTLNYDKMVTEKLDLLEKPVDENGEGGGGYITNSRGEYVLGNKVSVGGIVGEEDNTDIPSYGYQPSPDNEDTTYYNWDTEIEYSYIKHQIEKGNAELERATASVVVKDENLTLAKREELISLISASADIDPEQVFVSSYVGTVVEEPPEPTGEFDWMQNRTLLMYIGIGALVLILLIVALLLAWRKARRKRKEALEEKKLEEERLLAEQEIENYKQQLTESSKTNAAEVAVLDEMREFVTQNPEATANLIRSWLKEED